MRFRKLRIAWTVFWGLACILLIVLWVRSHAIRDSAFWPKNKFGMEINSMKGHAVLFVVFQPFPNEQTKVLHEKITPNDELRVKRGILGFLYDPEVDRFSVHVPFWFLALTLAAVAAAPWIRWSRRFTLRTLLIATTLVALVLGLAVYAAGK
jgi:hypothetical protein